MNGEYDMNSDAWDSVSDAGKDVIRWMMNVDPDKRMTAKELLSLSWFEQFFPDRNMPDTKRKVVGAYGQAMEDAEQFDGFDDEDDDDLAAGF